MSLNIEIDREEDGRWIAEINAIPGVMVYGQTRAEAVAKVQALALRVIADRLEHGEPIPQLPALFSVAVSAWVDGPPRRRSESTMPSSNSAGVSNRRRLSSNPPMGRLGR